MVRLTSKEEEILGYFWAKGPLFVRELLDLQEESKPHYNTLSTIVRSLEEKGYKVFYKNINLNYSIGKVRWRPFAGKYGRIATSPGNFDKELLIVEMPGSRLRSYDSRE